MAIKGLFSYNMQSAGAKELAEALGVPRIKHENSTFQGSKAKTVINWGASERVPPYISACTLINDPARVRVATDKHSAFRAMADAGVSTPEFTEDRGRAISWLEQGHTVFARKLTRASSGRGIEIMLPDHRDTWEVTAPLFTKYIKKRDEYRVHVVRGTVIDVQRKGLREEFQGRQDINHLVRNLANGFVFVRNDGREIPQCVRDVGVAAVAALQLDFGAVDIVYNARQERAYAIEVNTAPGLQGTTITSYANALRGL